MMYEQSIANRTVIVSNVPSEHTATELEATFADLNPEEVDLFMNDEERAFGLGLLTVAHPFP